MQLPNEGTYVEKCLTDRGKDICKPCPKSTWMLDVTSSDVPLPCEEYDSCPFGSIRVDYLPKSPGCHLPCICDTNKSFLDLIAVTVKYFRGSVLLDCYEENDLRPDNPVYIPIEGTTNKPNSAVGEIEVILKSNDSRNNSSAKDTHDSENPPPIPKEEINLVELPEGRRNDSETFMILDEEITLLKVPDRSRNDSGVSVSSHLENTNLMSDQEPDQISPRVKQVALVSPVPREHAEQESTTIQPSEETNSGAPCRLVISASTQEHNM
ncbi:unnamed protein product [Mytilus edulis]|uniref:Uncharacterized protein n=1 Tax=Mytilus edulis TaxID=6550 RepID=A0A8S3R5F2_MYTED|nr:unnamed protein product [Mytilus edulis]